MRIPYVLLLLLGIAGCNVNSQGEQKAALPQPAPSKAKRQTGRQITLDLIHSYMHTRAEQNDPKANEVLGRMYLFGVHLAKNYDKAEKYLRVSYQAGSVESAYLLGLMLARKDFERRDSAKSRAYLEEACKGGFTVACSKPRAKVVSTHLK